MPGRLPAVRLRGDEEATLLEMAGRRDIRARAVFMMADGTSHSEIARQLKIARRQVIRWHRYALAHGPALLRPGSGPGRPQRLSYPAALRVVDALRNRQGRTVAEIALAHGVSVDVVSRLRRNNAALRPFRRPCGMRVTHTPMDVVGVFVRRGAVAVAVVGAGSSAPVPPAVATVVSAVLARSPRALRDAPVSAWWRPWCRWLRRLLLAVPLGTRVRVVMDCARFADVDPRLDLLGRRLAGQGVVIDAPFAAWQGAFAERLRNAIGRSADAARDWTFASALRLRGPDVDWAVPAGDVAGAWKSRAQYRAGDTAPGGIGVHRSALRLPGRG